jgi:hypothetical protein
MSNPGSTKSRVSACLEATGTSGPGGYGGNSRVRDQSVRQMRPITYDKYGSAYKRSALPSRRVSALLRTALAFRRELFRESARSKPPNNAKVPCKAQNRVQSRLTIALFSRGGWKLRQPRLPGLTRKNGKERPVVWIPDRKQSPWPFWPPACWYRSGAAETDGPGQLRTLAPLNE